MSQQEVRQLFAAPLTLKEYCVIGLLCGSGLRISDVAALCIPDIGSAAKRIKVVQGKVAKDRYTLPANTEDTRWLPGNPANPPKPRCR